VPYFDYTYHGAAAGNCVALGALAAGNPAPNLQGLAGTAGAALPALGGLPAAGFAALPATGGRVPYTWAALTAASLIIGLYPAGAHPGYEMNWRVANLRMASYTAPWLVVNQGRLRRTPLLGNLETSERRYLSYFMGMNLSTYVALVSGFTYPMHFAKFAAINGGVGVGYTLNGAFAAANLPDIVFTRVANGTCQIWEAKGRVGAAAAGGFAVGGVAAVLTGAINQSRKIATALVGGVLTPPNAYIAAVARLDPTTYWSLDLDDPPNGKRKADDMDPAANEPLFENFYRPFAEVVADSTTTVSFGGRDYVVAELQGGVKVGLDQRIDRLFTPNPAKRPRTTGTNPPPDAVSAVLDYVAAGYPQDAVNADRFVTPEGIYVEAVESDITQPPPV
jgi:hypothetical protein